MRTKSWFPFGYAPSIAGMLVGVLLAGCHGNESPGSQLSWTPSRPAPSSGTVTPTGTLTISVVDPEGRPLADARVIVNREQVTTGANGVVTVGSLPRIVSVGVVHDFGLYTAKAFEVAQEGGTFLTLTVQPGRALPTVALLPVSIPSASISADRSELTLKVTIVSSAKAPFLPSSGTDPSGFPFLEMTLEGPRRQISIEQRHYEVPPALTAPLEHAPGSAMLLLDQSQRVASLDGDSRRSFAAREFIRRTVGSVEPYDVSVVGLAGTSATTTAALLPEQPVWSPLGADTAFSTDGVLLEAAIGDLEPLVGGSAPVFEGLRAALALTAAEAPPGNRSVVALLGGADDGEMTETSRASALASLRQLRDESGIQVVLIVGATLEQASDRRDLAELAAALQAPAVSLGISWVSPFGQIWASGSYGALDLAADLIDGLALPTLSADFRVEASEPGAFVTGSTLHGTVYVESEPCPFGCQYLPLEFAVEIP
jgi:hypothetical protein